MRWLFLVQVQMIPIHSTGVSKTIKEILKSIEEYALLPLNYLNSLEVWNTAVKGVKRNAGYRKCHRTRKEKLMRLDLHVLQVL